MRGGGWVVGESTLCQVEGVRGRGEGEEEGGGWTGGHGNEYEEGKGGHEKEGRGGRQEWEERRRGRRGGEGQEKDRKEGGGRQEEGGQRTLKCVF